MLERHKALYNQMVVNVNPNEMHVVFNTINVINFGRAMAFLTLVYLMHNSEDTAQRAQGRLDSRPPSIMGIERLIPRVASLTVDCRGVNISLTKQIWKLSNDNSVRYSVKTAYCCIVAILIMTCVLLYQVYLFLNCMGRAVILV